MKKILLCIIFIFFLSTPVYALDITLGANQNAYNNARLEDAQMFAIQLQGDNFLLFASYEKSFLRLMGQNVTDYEILGVGLGYIYEMNPILSVQLSCGAYFPSTDVIYAEEFEGRFNEGIHRYLNHLFADPEIRFWDCYGIEVSPALGFSVDLRWEKNIEDFSISLLLGYRYLRIRTRVLGWDIGHEPGDTVHGWWESWEMEDLSCAQMGLSFGYRF